MILHEVASADEVAEEEGDLAVVEFSRAEVLALRNLLEYAPHVPLEAPLGILERLLAELEPIAAVMGDE